MNPWGFFHVELLWVQWGSCEYSCIRLGCTSVLTSPGCMSASGFCGRPMLISANIQPSQDAAPIYPPTNVHKCARHSPFPPTLDVPGPHFISAALVGAHLWESHCGLICISLIRNDIDAFVAHLPFGYSLSWSQYHKVRVFRWLKKVVGFLGWFVGRFFFMYYG